MDKQFFLGFIGPISMDVYHVQSTTPYKSNTDTEYIGQFPQGLRSLSEPGKR